MRAPVRLSNRPASGKTLFVYGTLLRGEANHHILGVPARAIAEARTAPRYQLVDLGEYPVLLEGGTMAVRGELYNVDAGALRRLDRFEGHPSLFTRREIELENGARAAAYLAGPTLVLTGGVLVAGGDWRAFERRTRRRAHS